MRKEFQRAVPNTVRVRIGVRVRVRVRLREQRGLNTCTTLRLVRYLYLVLD